MVGSYSCVYRLLHAQFISSVLKPRLDADQQSVRWKCSRDQHCMYTSMYSTHVYNEGPGVSCRYAQLLSEHCSGVKSSIYLPSSVEVGYPALSQSMHNKNTHEEWHTVIIFSSQTMNTLKLVTLSLWHSSLWQSACDIQACDIQACDIQACDTAQTSNILN